MFQRVKRRGSASELLLSKVEPREDLRDVRDLRSSRVPMGGRSPGAGLGQRLMDRNREFFSVGSGSNERVSPLNSLAIFRSLGPTYDIAAHGSRLDGHAGMGWAVVTSRGGCGTFRHELP
jgi:hypothetical protein